MNREEAATTALRMVLAGYGRLDILEYLRTKSATNQNPPRTPARLIYGDALARLRDLPPADDETRLAYCREITRGLLEKMVAAGDYDGALRAAKELARLFDAYALAREDRDAVAGAGAGETTNPKGAATPNPTAGQIIDLTGLLEKVRGAAADA
jgi:hypothetical protein